MPNNRPSKPRSGMQYNPLEPRQLLAATTELSSVTALYQVDDSMQESIARKYLSQQTETSRLAHAGSNLELVEIKRGLASTVTRFRQTYLGTPIADAWVTTIQGPQGDFVQVHDQSFSGRFVSLVPLRMMDFATGEQIALDHAGAKSTFAPTRGELVWMPTDGKSAHPTWQITVYGITPEEHGDFLTYVNPVTGEVLSQENRVAHFTTGSGDVFYPNPFQTQGSGSGLADNNDANSLPLTNELISVTLEGLDEGTGLLTGEFVDLATLNSPSLADNDANEPTRVYEYTRDDDRFEQVVIYHTVDQINRYFHSLGFDDDTGVPNGIRDFPTLANAHWFNDDQSFYSTGDDAIHFGDGGVDDGEDGDIIAHEYGHAIQHNQNASWGGGEMGAMGEGFGDYLAASFFQSHGDVAFQANHAAAVGEWDATSYSSDNPPNLRRVDGNKMYPTDLVGQVHADGEIWSRALWDINQTLGAALADQLVLESHFLLPGGASMVTAAEMILLADQNVNGGVNAAVIRQAFEDRGILEPPDTIGSLTLDKSVYSVGDTVMINVTDGNGPSSIQVTVTSSNGDSETLTLTGNAGLYEGSIASVAGSAVSSDGQLQAAIGDTFTVSYLDTDDGAGGSLTASDSAEFADIKQYTSADTPIGITDNNSISSVITVPDSGNLADLDLQLDITHTYVGDLTGVLTAPNGTQITLFDRIGGSGDNFDNTIFDDEATTSINSGSAPFAGAYQPDESFMSLDGISITGDWTLTITDGAGGDTGALNSWSLFIVSDPLPPAATLELDKSEYTVGESIDIIVTDGNGPATIPVTITSSNGDTETLTLSNNQGRYSTTISTVAGSANAGDGQLQAAVGDTFTVSYLDTDDGTGTPMTASDSGTFVQINEYAAADLPQDITDNNTIESTITITDQGDVLDVDLVLNLTHTYVGDLTGILTGPNGEQITLFNRIGGSGDDFTDTRFDDEAFQSIENGSAPFSGSFRPSENLGLLDGISMTGDWVLSITDSAGGDEGTLDSWSLFITVQPNLPIGPVLDSNTAADEVAENAAAGTPVGITATASDPGDTVSFILTDDAGGRFAIDANSGVVTVNGPLDYETATSHSIEVEATSTDGSTSSETFNISILNVDDAVISTRQIFYAGSTFAGSGDFDAVASDKQFLLDGQKASFANYSSYYLGINGLVLEVNDLNEIPTLGNLTDFFTFKVGNDSTPSNWNNAPAPTGITYVPNVDASGTDRVFLTWGDNAIENTWLQVTVLAGAATGLAADDIFYFGNVIGETGNSTDDAIVNLQDVANTRGNQSGFSDVAIDNAFDFDRNGRVNLVDVAIARANQSGFSVVKLITPNGTNKARSNLGLPTLDPSDDADSHSGETPGSSDRGLLLSPPASQVSSTLLPSSEKQSPADNDSKSIPTTEGGQRKLAQTDAAFGDLVTDLETLPETSLDDVSN